jgi:hypothetical protein
MVALDRLSYILGLSWLSTTGLGVSLVTLQAAVVVVHISLTDTAVICRWFRRWWCRLLIQIILYTHYINAGTANTGSGSVVVVRKSAVTSG